MTTDNNVVFIISKMVRRLNSSKEELTETLDVLIDLQLVVDMGETLFLPECESRLALIRGGKKGGETSSKKKPISKPIDKPISKPIDKPIDKPISKPISKPIDKPISKPISKPTIKPICKQSKLKEKKLKETTTKKVDDVDDLKDQKEEQQIDDSTANFKQKTDGLKEAIAKPDYALWRETFYMQQKLKSGSLSALLENFNQHLILQPPDFPNQYKMKQYQSHFINWLRIQDQKGKLKNFKTTLRQKGDL